MPGCWLREGDNEIVVFDIMGPREARSMGRDKPVLDKLLHHKRPLHREEGEELDLTGLTPAVAGTFAPGNGWQEVRLDAPQRGRYVCLEFVDALDGKDVASMAEFYVVDADGNRLSREPWLVDYADSEDVAGRQPFGRQDVRPPGVDILVDSPGCHLSPTISYSTSRARATSRASSISPHGGRRARRCAQLPYISAMSLLRKL